MSTKENVNFHQLFDDWKHGIRYSVKDSSYFFYETMIEHHLRPYFGNRPVCQLCNEWVENFIRCKLDEKLSLTYIHSILILFQSILKYSGRTQQITIPPIYLRLPRSEKHNLKLFSLQEWNVLDDYLSRQRDDFSFGLRLCMYTGLRIGELSGLKWGDIDTVTGCLSVRRTVYRMKNDAATLQNGLPRTQLCIASPKTQSSLRDIPLPHFIIEETALHRKSAETFLLTGTLHCMEPRNIQKRYKKLLEKCHLNYRNFHSLRHSFATLGIQKGFDYKTLSELLGHASVNTTLNIYVHSDLERKRQCMELWNK
jgi:integrase